jgi:hypothetical protein
MQRSRNLQGLEHLDNGYTDAREEAMSTHRTSQGGNRCGHGTKSVGAACVKRSTPVTMALGESVSEDLNRMAWYLMNRERLIREAVEAGEEAIEAFDRARAQR